MTSALFVLVGTALIVLQTSVLPLFGLRPGGCDLLVPLVVFLGLLRRPHEGLPAVIVTGLMVDNLSGAPPGYYLTAYLWIWALMRWLIGFLRVADTFMLPAALAGAVMVENAVVLAVPFLLGREVPESQRVLEIVARQMAWTVLTGPFWVAGFAALQRRLRRYRWRARLLRAVLE